MLEKRASDREKIEWLKTFIEISEKRDRWERVNGDEVLAYARNIWAQLRLQ